MVDGDGVDDAAVVGVGVEGLAGFEGVEGDGFAAGDYFCTHYSI